MGTKESRQLQEIEVLRCQLDEKLKERRELEEQVRILEAAAEKAQALRERVAAAALAEKVALKRLAAAEAVTRGYKYKLERQGQ